MAKSTKFVPQNTGSGWRINVPAKYAESGKRERHFFRTRDQAMAAAQKLRESREQFGTRAGSISPSLAEMAVAAAELLSPFGISILEAAKRVRDQEAVLRSSIRVELALEAFEQAKSDKSLKQVQAIRHMTNHLREDFNDRMMASLTTEEIAEHVARRTRGPSAFNARIRLLATLWRWSSKSPRNWCKSDVLSSIETKEVVSSEIGTLNADQATDLMLTAERYFPDTVPAYAIALFTGMRQQEIERLTPSDIRPEGIEVPAIMAKTKRRRFIHMPPPLAAWLQVYPIGDFVCPPNWNRKDKAVRRLAGWRVWSDLVTSIDVNPKLTESPDLSLPEWPHNVLRHTAASVALALGKPLEILIFEHGHAGGVEMLRRHYIGRMPKKEAARIWRLGPRGTEVKLD